jgi:hypothetical protein
MAMGERVASRNVCPNRGSVGQVALTRRVRYAARSNDDLEVEGAMGYGTAVD